MPVIAVVGSRQSGKTTTAEALIRGLTDRGYQVAAAKHIPEADFTIDTREKDTWKQAQAGARTIVAAAPKELAVIKKVDTTKYGLNKIVKAINAEGIDILVVEGFRKMVAADFSVPKIVTIKTAAEVSESLQYFRPILAFSAPSFVVIKESKIPRVDVHKDSEKLIEIVDQRIGPIVKKRRAQKETLKIQVNEETLPLNPFVQNFIRNVVLSMVSTLKAGSMKGDKDISIEIVQRPREESVHG